MDKTRVENIDCMIRMRETPDKFYELAIVDPEYGIGASNPSIKPNIAVQKNGNILHIKQPNYIPKKWDFQKSGEDYFNELFRVSENQIIWGANYYGFIGGMIVWDKLNGGSDQMDCEIAYCSMNNRCDLVYFMWAGMFQGIYCGKDVRKAIIQQGNKQLNEQRIHPTQKPVALYKWLLKNYAKEGDKILSTHVGSGSDRIAAFDMGFDFIGYEIDADYFNAQEKRFNQHKSQLKLFPVK